MTIKTGDKIPTIAIKIMAKNGPQDVILSERYAGEKIVIFAVPGAFTPTCSNAHLPGYVVHADSIKQKGVSAILCLSVNDVFVMHAWGKSANAENIVMVADGNGDFNKAMGLDMDATAWGMGHRCKRYAMIVEDGIVTHLNVESSGQFEASKAETILALL